jgi:uroporphyrinogen III methyltransferase/synthase
MLKKADVVVYDRLIGAEILDYAPKDAELIYVGKASSNHSLPQEEINELLVQKARQGKTVARLKGGDPFVFGRGGEEALYLKENGLDFEIVPGITSAVAVPAYAGIPVTHRDANSGFAVITGHEKPGKAFSSIQWNKIAGIGTLVFLMGLENLEYIVDNLLNAGSDRRTPAAVIRRGTFPDQKVVSGTLEDIVGQVREAALKPPAILVVGETVGLRSKLQWLENKPLWGKRILVTRARAQASDLVRRIRELGGEALEFPSIELQPEGDLSRLHAAMQVIDQYRWIIFTSTNAVDIFFAQLQQRGRDIRDLKGVRIAAIGPATAKNLSQRGLLIDLLPNEYQAEGIIAGLRSQIKSGDRVLLPRARGARAILPDSLREMGAVVDEVVIYQAVPAADINDDLIAEIKNDAVDFITFTSSSTVANFVNILGRDNIADFNRRVKVACIGPITADTARECGFTVDVLASTYTIEGLLTAIVKAAGELAEMKEEDNK